MLPGYVPTAMKKTTLRRYANHQHLPHVTGIWNFDIVIASCCSDEDQTEKNYKSSSSKLGVC